MEACVAVDASTETELWPACNVATVKCDLYFSIFFVDVSMLHCYAYREHAQTIYRSESHIDLLKNTTTMKEYPIYELGKKADVLFGSMARLDIKIGSCR